MSPYYPGWLTFLSLAGWGIVAGLIFDLYRVMRYFWQPSYWVTQLTDLLFWLMLLITTFALLLLSNYGEVRSYVFLAFSLGWGVYHAVASWTARSVFYQAGRLFCRLWAFWGKSLRN